MAPTHTLASLALPGLAKAWPISLPVPDCPRQVSPRARLAASRPGFGGKQEFATGQCPIGEISLRSRASGVDSSSEAPTAGPTTAADSDESESVAESEVAREREAMDGGGARDGGNDDS
eukprot:13789731-Alexandrium_andersonii.AAC.1